MIKNQVSVGNNVTLGQGCVLVRNVFDNETIVGNPGVNIEEYKKWSKIRQQLIAGINGLSELKAQSFLLHQQLNLSFLIKLDNPLARD